jgi:Flp pilus assembly protein TadD
MKARQAVLCPKCGARNRSAREFCARCNEPLEDAVPAEEQESPEPAAEGEERASATSGTAIAVVTVLAVVGLGVAGWRYASQAPPLDQPNPSLFTVATRPAALPTAAPPAGPGAAEYAEGRRLMTAGDLVGAAVKLAAAAAASPENADYQSAYADALWQGGDREGALSARAEAARLDPRRQIPYARSLDVAGRGEDAVREYEAILARNPGAPTVQEDLGRLLYRQKSYAQAAPHLQQAVQARPDDPVLAQELGYALDQAGDHAQAAAVYRRVLAQAPQAVMARGLLADNLLGQGKGGEATAVLREGLRSTPDSPLLQRQLGSVLERAGQPGEAAVAYRAYARLAPNAPDAKDLAARADRLEAAGARP